MIIVNTLLIIIGLGLIGYAALNIVQYKNYTFKNAKIRKQQGTITLIGLAGVIILLLAFILIKT